MGERLFSPWSLARVCEAVEWEDELVQRPNGSTNQEQYMRALGTLWERWMRGWSLPDFAGALKTAGSGAFLEGLLYLLKSVPERIQQIKGFYEGLWAGANPDVEPRAPGARAFVGEVPEVEQKVAAALRAWLLQIQSIVSSI